MKNSTVLTSVVLWFAILGGLAFGLTNPEALGTTDVVGHGVNSSISTLTSILCMAVPFVVLGAVTVVGFVFHKETVSKKTLA